MSNRGERWTFPEQDGSESARKAPCPAELKHSPIYCFEIVDGVANSISSELNPGSVQIGPSHWRRNPPNWQLA
jgi:hypothetical protein